ncbi:hypothetical protein JTB14_035965 [Gonioctena quinquepunctata]|nr:hypothetical protein JTB14_035965 [Gonioctena quinquepunctata]
MFSIDENPSIDCDENEESYQPEKTSESDVERKTSPFNDVTPQDFGISKDLLESTGENSKILPENSENLSKQFQEYNGI